MSIAALEPRAERAARSTVARRRAGLLAEVPWALPVGASAVAWALYVALRLAGGGGHARHLLLAGTMAVAMMAPLAVPSCAAAARATEWQHAARGVMVSFATFASVWVAVGAVMHVGTEAVAALAPGRVVAVALAGWAAFDAASRRRASRLEACAVTRPVLPGARTWGSADAAAVAARRCVGTCWAPMALTVVDPRAVVLVVVSAALVAERVVAPRPRLPVAGAFALLAVLAAWTLP
jgi:Predicted metal-binding integral membrane protein (DUF2182)